MGELPWQGTVAIETVKLIAQLGGALFVARVAVRWALERYKSEKMWERHLAAYVDVVTALAEMKRVLGVWEEYILRISQPSDEQATAQRERWSAASRRFEEVAATAQLLLPGEIAGLLARAERDLDSAGVNLDEYRANEAQYEVVNSTLKEVISHGRRALGPLPGVAQA